MNTIKIDSSWGVNVYVLNKIVSFGHCHEKVDGKFTMYIETTGHEANILTFDTKEERGEVFNRLIEALSQLKLSIYEYP